MKLRRHGSLIVLVSALTVIGAIAFASASSAVEWPWQHDDVVHLTGEVSCNDFYISSDSPIPFGPVEGFEIRGRSNVLTTLGHGMLDTYDVEVPSGWVVQYAIKCASDHQWHSGKDFRVDGKLLGSGTQYRNICYGGAGLLNPCSDRALGACVTALLTSGVGYSMPFEKALLTAYNADHTPGLGTGDCARALAAASHLDAAPVPAEPPPSLAPLPTPQVEPLPSLAPSPVVPNVYEEPTADATPEPSGSRTVVVSNLVTNGESEMREDTPSYLSTKTQNGCKSSGCALPNTDVGTGGSLLALCQISGDRTTNGEDQNSIDDFNPGLFTGNLWYRIQWGDGREGYISTTWLQPSSRGGLDLVTCQ